MGIFKDFFKSSFGMWPPSSPNRSRKFWLGVQSLRLVPFTSKLVMAFFVESSCREGPVKSFDEKTRPLEAFMESGKKGWAASFKRMILSTSKALHVLMSAPKFFGSPTGSRTSKPLGLLSRSTGLSSGVFTSSMGSSDFIGESSLKSFFSKIKSGLRSSE